MTRVSKEYVEQHVVVAGERVRVRPPESGSATEPAAPAAVDLPQPAGGTARECPPGASVGAYCVDRGGSASLGLWARSPRGYAWLEKFPTLEKLRERVPEARNLAVERYTYPNLLALNFLVPGLLGEGVAASTRSDPQAETLGEYVRAKVVPVPTELPEECSAT